MSSITHSDPCGDAVELRAVPLVVRLIRALSMVRGWSRWYTGPAMRRQT